MKLTKCSLALVLSLLLMALAGCADKETADQVAPQNAQPETTAVAEQQKSAPEQMLPPQPAQLPVRFQAPGYLTAPQQATDEEIEEVGEEFHMKVGASIRSTGGPQPLWDILNRLAGLKQMSVSWASDVDQNVLVDVNITAEEDFFTAIDNMLRQVEYHQVVEGNTIVVKHRETKKFYLSIPYMKGSFTSSVGGNYLTDREAATGTEGTVKITSAGNEFDVWANVQANLDIIMQQWATETVTAPAPAENGAEGEEEDAAPAQATRRMASGGSYYTIDKSIGLITVSAPRPLLAKVETYIENLKEELFRQVVIEAKIIEVYLQDNSKIGIDWSSVLEQFPISGTVSFGGAGGQVYPSVDSFISQVNIGSVGFDLFLNALNEQGDARVLANPKLTVLNGQPAMLSVGTDVTYIKAVESDVNNETGTISYTVETDSVVEGIALGVLASVVDDNSVILHLTPITTDLEGDTVENEEFGLGQKVGLPIVKVRDMSTMVQVKNGEMLVIGGLIDSVERKNEKFAPGVGSIPLVKYLFGYEEKIQEKRELVILLTPRII